jgi:hypothetical protein
VDVFLPELGGIGILERVDNDPTSKAEWAVRAAAARCVSSRGVSVD